MSHLFALAWRSAWNRRYALGLTLASIALASFLLLAVERLRADVRQGFDTSVSGTDLVVGPRGSGLQLMLYAVFRIGEPSANMSWAAAKRVAEHPAVAWAIPLALGDSYRSFPVIGTTPAYFRHFRHGGGARLRFAQGRGFADGLPGTFQTVLGSEVARRTGKGVGDSLALSHGASGFAEEAGEHADKPFTVVGVLAPTGTPVDRSVHISLAGMQAIHLEWQGGMPVPGVRIPAEMVRKFDLTPQSVTAVLVGLKQRSDVFRMQREIAAMPEEALMGVMPGVALDELWQVAGVAERALLATSALVALVSLAGLVAAILAGLDARRRELAILRSVGARPRELLMLLSLEALSVTALGALLGAVLRIAALHLAAPLLQSRFGFAFGEPGLSSSEWALLGAIVACGALAGLLPGWRAYRLSLADGLSPRL